MNAFVEAEALGGVASYFEKAADTATPAARMAVNKVIGGTGRTRIKRQMESQVAWPRGYIDDRRLYVGQRATDADLTASLVGRQRATSLARFDPGAAPGKKGATVMVRPGRSRPIKDAFFIRLRAGDELTEDTYNLGLAIRLKPGERILNKRTQPFNGDAALALLYGPSVDQVMLDAADEEAPVILEAVETEFLRNFARMTETA